MPESSYDPQRDGPYAQWLKAKRVGSTRRTFATRDQVTVHREDGRVVAQTRQDQLGNKTTEHTSGRVDVTINLEVPGGDQ